MMKLAMTLLFLEALFAISAPVVPRYLAPYYIPEDSVLIADQYIVLLYPNHTLAAHFKAIGLELEQEQNAGFFRHLDTINGYFAELDYHTVHSLIRLDPGVEIVEHNAQFASIRDFESGEAFNSSTGASTDSNKRPNTFQIRHSCITNCNTTSYEGDDTWATTASSITTQPTSSTSPSPPPPTRSPAWHDVAEPCGLDKCSMIGASNCMASDGELPYSIGQCNSEKNCQACKICCCTFG